MHHQFLRTLSVLLLIAKIASAGTVASTSRPFTSKTLLSEAYTLQQRWGRIPPLPPTYPPIYVIGFSRQIDRAPIHDSQQVYEYYDYPRLLQRFDFSNATAQWTQLGRFDLNTTYLFQRDAKNGHISNCRAQPITSPMQPPNFLQADRFVWAGVHQVSTSFHPRGLKCNEWRQEEQGLVVMTELAAQQGPVELQVAAAGVVNQYGPLMPKIQLPQSIFDIPNVCP